MKKIFLLSASIFVLLLISCEDEEVVTVEVIREIETTVTETVIETVEVGEVNDPSDDLIPDFSYTNEGNVFSFTNLTEDTSELLWFFGDATIVCNSENPMYEFGSEGGNIDVTLIASNGGGEEFETTQTITAPEVISEEGEEEGSIVIDGEFDDWNDIPALVDESELASNTGALKVLKVLAEGNTFNIYLQGTSDLGSRALMYIDTDGDVSTGQSHWAFTGGAEVYFESDLISGGGLFFENYSVLVPRTSTINTASEVVTIDDVNIIEFNFSKSEIGSSGDIISIGIVGLLGNGWDYAGHLPSTGSFINYTIPIEDNTVVDVITEDVIVCQ